MNVSERQNSTHILRPNRSLTPVDIPSMSDMELKTLKAELKNVRQTIVDNVASRGLEGYEPVFDLLAFHICDPSYKYPSFDFISMFLHCYLVSFIRT